jgi:hypothetical protein
VPVSTGTRPGLLDRVASLAYTRQSSAERLPLSLIRAFSEQAMAKVIDGTPQVQASEVSNSTWHKIAARQAV